jgi:hypothetical protein
LPPTAEPPDEYDDLPTTAEILDAYAGFMDEYAGVLTYEQYRAQAEAWYVEARRQAGREGYQSARADMVSGAFVSGPTYRALRDSHTGRQIAKEALRMAAELLRTEDRLDEQTLAPYSRSKAAAYLEGLADA